MPYNYSDLFSEHEVVVLKDADAAITQCDLWDWLREYTPEDGKGFMFSEHPNLTRINNAMKYTGHSGASYGWTMRQMEYIAKHGWDLFEFTVREQRRKDEEVKRKYEATEHYKECTKNLETAEGANRGKIIRSMFYARDEILKELNDPTLRAKFPYPCSCHLKMGLRGWCGVASGGVPGCEY